MNGRMRRGLVILAVIVSLVGGVVSIQIASELAAAAAPPPAPPVSMASLQTQLKAEQDRAAYLQAQLEDLVGVTGELTAALDSTETLVNDDGATAKELRDRLKAAEARLAKVTRLLKKAADRLASLGVVGPTVPPTTRPPSTGGGGASPTPAPTPKPTAAPGTFSLTVKASGGGVAASWTACSLSGFSSYALVRSTDSEIHYPPEDRDTLVANITSSATRSATDASAPSGQLWYRLYCLTRRDGETKVGATTKTVAINVP